LDSSSQPCAYESFGTRYRRPTVVRAAGEAAGGDASRNGPSEEGSLFWSGVVRSLTLFSIETFWLGSLRLSSFSGAWRGPCWSGGSLTEIRDVPSHRTTRTALSLVLRRRSCNSFADSPLPAWSYRLPRGRLRGSLKRSRPSRPQTVLIGILPWRRRLSLRSALCPHRSVAGDADRTAGSALVVPPAAPVGEKRLAPSSLHVVSHRLTSLPRSSAALPCHRRVSIGGIHDRRALTLVWVRVQLRGPASCRRVAGHPVPPDLRPPFALDDTLNDTGVPTACKWGLMETPLAVGMR
jgi:hypothetical protein